MIKLAFYFFILFIFVSIALSRILRVDFGILVFTGIILFSFFSLPVARGILQGRKKFLSLGISMITESIIKLFLAILFVYLGARVYGAIGGVVIGLLVTLLMAFFLMKEITKSKRKKADIKEIYSYSKPILIATLAIVLMYSLDIIIAKSFFDVEIAGQYAVASMMGKMIFFGTVAISKAMFPITSEKFEKKHATKSLLYKSIGVVFIMSIIVVLLFGLFPKFLITILFGKDYTIVSNILIYTGIAFSLLSLANVIVLYGLAVNKLKNPFILFFCVVLEIVLLSIYNANLMHFSIALLISSLIMFITAILLTKK